MTDIDRSKIRRLDFTLLLIMQGLLRYRRTVQVADELGLSQPAISHALRRLRDVFGGPLFVRRPHGLEPTRHALELAPLIDRLVEQAQEAVGLVRHFDPETSDRFFRAAAPDLIGPMLSGPLLQRFEKDAPGTRFALRNLVGDEALVALRQDQLDVAIGQFASTVVGMDVEDLYQDEYVLVTRANHSTCNRRATKKLIESLSFVTISTAGELRGFTDDELERQGVHRRIIASVPRFQIALETVRRTNSALLSPRRLAETYARAFRLELRTLPVSVSPFRVLMVSRKNPDPGRDWLKALVRKVLR